MKTITFFYLCCFVTLFAQTSSAQTYYYDNTQSIEGDDYEVSFDNAVSKNDYCKMATKVTNNSLDFIMIETKETVYKNGTVEQNHPKKKTFIVSPGKKKSYTMVFDGNGGYDYNVQNFSIDFGGLYLIPSDGEKVKAPKFNLPASDNEIEAGDFVIKLKKLKKETKETIATFEVMYKGREIGLVHPSNLVAVFTGRGGAGYANDNKNAASEVLERGDKCTVKAVFHISAKDGDMQFVPMQIIWKDTFQTTKKEKLDRATIDFQLGRKK
ncbi:hypothetical protein [Aureispira sp. CCB-QB1]|uniref:hypothetical protein n=1 Tax=Aureispira sp. CCB-QB1 TaxID=1313421 RepID=UPI0006982A0A|nr:hypothetical protein [Aureispira sp. CCB-QB1]